jgi:hypothetical protein
MDFNDPYNQIGAALAIMAALVVLLQIGHYLIQKLNKFK